MILFIASILVHSEGTVPALLRLFEFLANYNFTEIKYVQGKENVVPDFLSHP